MAGTDMTAEPEYIITEEQVRKWGDYVEDDDNHTEAKYKNARGLAATIRSRLYNPPSNYPNCYATYECGYFNNNFQSEREKVLDELLTWVREYDTMYYGDDMPVESLIDKLKELRQGKVEK